MTSLLQKIGLVLGTTAIVAGSAYAAPKIDGVKFTAPNVNGHEIDYTSKGGKWGYMEHGKWKATSDQRRVDGQYDQYLFAKAQKDSMQNQMNAGKEQRVPQMPQQIKQENKTYSGVSEIKKEDEKQGNKSSTPSNGYWIFGVGGDTNNRAFGLVERDWKYGQDERHRFGLGLKLYSGSEVVHGDESTKTTDVSEALVGPNLYRIRTDKTTTRTDRKDGQLEIFVHFGYVPEFLGNQVELFGNFGATQYKEINHEKIDTKVKFEDSKGNPVGKTEYSTMPFKPKTENYIAPTAELGLTWEIPKTNTRLGISEEISPELGAKTNATIEFKF